MQLLKLKKHTSNRVELAKFIVSVYCTLSGIKINNTATEVMAYFMVYGLRRSTKDLILNSKILNSMGSLENVISLLKRKGLLTKTLEGGQKVCPELNFNVESKMGILIQLDNG